MCWNLITILYLMFCIDVVNVSSRSNKFHSRVTFVSPVSHRESSIPRTVVKPKFYHSANENTNNNSDDSPYMLATVRTFDSRSRTQLSPRSPRSAQNREVSTIPEIRDSRRVRVVPSYMRDTLSSRITHRFTSLKTALDDVAFHNRQRTSSINKRQNIINADILLLNPPDKKVALESKQSTRKHFGKQLPSQRKRIEFELAHTARDQKHENITTLYTNSTQITDQIMTDLDEAVHEKNKTSDCYHKTKNSGENFLPTISQQNGCETEDTSDCPHKENNALNISRGSLSDSKTNSFSEKRRKSLRLKRKTSNNDMGSPPSSNWLSELLREIEMDMRPRMKTMDADDQLEDNIDFY